MDHVGTQSRKLRRLDSNELREGMVVHTAIRDHQGRVVVRAGQTLTAEHLDSLSARATEGLFVPATWTARMRSETDESEEILKILNARSVIDGKVTPRRHARHTWTVPLRVAVEERFGSDTHYRQLDVQSCDISAGGLAFFYQQFIHPGTVIHVELHSLPNVPRVTAVVRDCRLVGARRHRIGAEIVHVQRHDPDAGDPAPQTVWTPREEE